MFDCYDMAGIKITTAVYSDCNPSLDLTMTASEFAALKDAIANAGASNLTVTELFAVPSVQDLQSIFSLALNNIIFLYLFAYLVGVVVNFITER